MTRPPTPPGPERRREKRNAVLLGLVLAIPLPLAMGFRPGLVIENLWALPLLLVALYWGK
jgi:hypothetical protein